MTFDNNNNPDNDPQQNNKEYFKLGILWGIFFHAVPLLITAITSTWIYPGITVILPYIIIIYILSAYEKVEILKGFILGTILVPFIVGACFGILIILQFFN